MECIPSRVRLATQRANTDIRRHLGQVGVVTPAPDQTHKTGDVIDEPHSASPAELVGSHRHVIGLRGDDPNLHTTVLEDQVVSAGSLTRCLQGRVRGSHHPRHIHGEDHQLSPGAHTDDSLQHVKSPQLDLAGAPVLVFLQRLDFAQANAPEEAMLQEVHHAVEFRSLTRGELPAFPGVTHEGEHLLLESLSNPKPRAPMCVDLRKIEIEPQEGTDIRSSLALLLSERGAQQVVEGAETPLG